MFATEDAVAKITCFADRESKIMNTCLIKIFYHECLL